MFSSLFQSYSLILPRSLALVRFTGFLSFQRFFRSLRNATPKTFSKQPQLNMLRKHPSIVVPSMRAILLEFELIERFDPREKSIPSSLYFYYYGSSGLSHNDRPPSYPFKRRDSGPSSLSFYSPSLTLSQWREVPDFCPIKKLISKFRK